jgi:hypothetical protein
VRNGTNVVQTTINITTNVLVVILFPQVYISLPRVLLILKMLSDVLARHLRRCDKGDINKDLLPKGSAKRPRAKTACNECAKSKLKCDSQNPCGHCMHSSLQCQYTRQGYSDPYIDFRVSRGPGVPSPPDNEIFQDWPEIEYPPSLSNDSTSTGMNSNGNIQFAVLNHELDNSTSQQHEVNIDFSLSTADIYISDEALMANGNSCSIHNDNVLTNLDFSNMFDFPFDAESLLLFPDTIGYVPCDLTGAVERPNKTNKTNQANQASMIDLSNPDCGKRLQQYLTSNKIHK